jgi:hypothetical protein
MKPGQLISVLLLALTALCRLAATGVWADEPSTATPLVQANEERARLHYLAGEAALRSGDPLTAVVEWENTLRLKPSSAHTAKVLATAAIKLGTDGSEAYAHLVNAGDLQDQGKLDGAEKELALAMTYYPSGSTPGCLTEKSLELADLAKESKQAEASQPKPATTTAAKKTTASTSKPSASTAKKKATTSKPKSARTSTPKAARPPAYRPPTLYPHRTSSRLTYVHGHTIDGHYVPGHYAIKPMRLP